MSTPVVTNPSPLDSTGPRRSSRAELTVDTPDGPLAARLHLPAGPVHALVVAAHGLYLSGNSWNATAELLCARPRAAAVLTYDHRGHGRSPHSRRDGALGLDLLAGDLLAVLHAAAQGLDGAMAFGPSVPMVLAGHSLGAMSALTMLTGQHALPESLRAAVLVSASAGCLTGGGLLRMLPALAARHPGAFERGQSMFRAALTPVIGRPAPNQDDHVLSSLDAAQLLASLGAYDLVARLRQLPVGLPLRLLTGGSDRITPCAHAACIAQAVPGATVRVLPDAGHNLPAERPAAVAATIAGAVDEALD